MLTSMPSLNYFHFESIPSIIVLSGLTNALRSYSNLIHIYIVKHPGNNLTLPLDYSCYRNVEKIYLDYSDFIFSDELAKTISKCKLMKVLALKISAITATGIANMFDSLSSLMIFLFERHLIQHFDPRKLRVLLHTF